MDPQKPFDLRAAIDDETKKLVAETLKTIPPGKRGALLVIADKDGARAHVAARLGDEEGAEWKVALAAGTSWKGDISGQVALQGSW